MFVDRMNLLESTKIYKKGIIVQEYRDGDILIQSVFEKQGRIQVCTHVTCLTVVVICWQKRIERFCCSLSIYLYPLPSVCISW